MAISYITFQKMLHIFGIFGIFTNTWPPHPDAGKKELLLREFYYLFIIIIFLITWIPLIMNICMNEIDISTMMKDVSHTAALGESILNMVLCRANRKELQILLSHMKEFTSTSKDYEKVILQKYVDRYSTFILLMAICFIMAGLGIVFSPLFLDEELPANVWYPFSTKPLSRRIPIYSIQVFMASHTAFSFCVDVLITIFLLYTTARLEILNQELQQATEDTHVESCIRKHQELIRSFITEIQHAIRYILFKSVFTMAFTVISGCFPLLYIKSHILIPQFVSMVIAALQRMYVTAWPANDLKEVSVEFALSAYSMTWIGKSRRLQSDLLIIIQRSQKPLLIQMGGFFPALTLEFFASFVINVVSYFTTMRAAMSATLI